MSAAEIRRERPQGTATVMEVCGGQTHTILRWGLDQRLPAGMALIHGPGCPVCVTPLPVLEAAMALAQCPEVILCSYGDMLRVPLPVPADPQQRSIDLLSLRAAGADVRLITQPQQALQIALQEPQRQVVLLAVGFETTAPATALVAIQRRALQLRNLHLLVAHVRVVPAMARLLSSPESRLDALLAPGHVCSVIGLAEMEALAHTCERPVVGAGLSHSHPERALQLSGRMLERGDHGLRNAYREVVQEQGNPRARALLAEVLEPIDLAWRGLGLIEAGGLALKGAYVEADVRWGLDRGDTAAALAPLKRQGQALTRAPAKEEPEICRAAAVLQGHCLPSDCPAFGSSCRPEHPLGAPMVSEEGACAAWMQYRGGG
ncbi:MAG: protein required for maturation of hydrogenase [Cyanobacteriota bacterium]